MKKTFSLLEFVLVIIILSTVLFVLINPSLKIFEYSLNLRSKNTDFWDLNQAIFYMEKMYNKCLNSKIHTDKFECYFDARDDVFVDTSLNTLAYSGIILKKDDNLTSPNSNFKFMLNNYKNLLFNYKNNINFIFLYNLQEQKIYKLKINNKNELKFYNDKFDGFYTAVYAYIKIYFKDKNIYLNVDNLNGKSKDFLLMQDVSFLEFEKHKNYLDIKLCRKECLSKMVY